MRPIAALLLLIGLISVGTSGCEDVYGSPYAQSVAGSNQCGELAVDFGSGCECIAPFEWCDRVGGDCCVAATSCNGDGLCNLDESPASCPSDCGTAESCPDGVCDAEEERTGSCSADCGTTQPPARGCEDLGCAEQLCEEFCENRVGCGDATSYASCVEECADLREEADYFDPRTDRECREVYGRLYGCLVELSCSDISHYWEEDIADYPCEAEDDSLDSQCEYLPYEFRIELTQALIAPTKPDGCQWDLGCNGVPEELLNEIAGLLLDAAAATATANGIPIGSALTQSKLDQVFGAMLGAAVDHLSKPDAFGSVEVIEGGQTIARWEIPETADSFIAEIPRTVTEVMAVGTDIRIRVSLQDNDLTSDDPIGTVDVTRADLLRAYTFGEPHWVLTAESVNDGILQVKVSVIGLD